MNIIQNYTYIFLLLILLLYLLSQFIFDSLNKKDLIIKKNQVYTHYKKSNQHKHKKDKKNILEHLLVYIGTKTLNTLPLKSQYYISTYYEHCEYILGLAVISIIQCLIYLIQSQIILGIVFAIFFILSLFYPPIKKHLEAKELDEQINHIIHCLYILSIKSGIPLSKSLEIIIEFGIEPDSNSYKFLKNILNQIESKGNLVALQNIQLNTRAQNTFKNLMQNINNSSSNTSLKQQGLELLKEHQYEEEIKMKNKAENLNLILIVPILVMLLIATSPIYISINYMLNNI